MPQQSRSPVVRRFPQRQKKTRNFSYSTFFATFLCNLFRLFANLHDLSLEFTVSYVFDIEILSPLQASI